MKAWLLPAHTLTHLTCHMFVACKNSPSWISCMHNVNIHSPATLCTPVQMFVNQIHNISQSHGRNLMHLGMQTWSKQSAEVQTEQFKHGMVVPDGLDWVFHKLLIYWVLYQRIVWKTENIQWAVVQCLVDTRGHRKAIVTQINTSELCRRASLNAADGLQQQKTTPGTNLIN